MSILTVYLIGCALAFVLYLADWYCLFKEVLVEDVLLTLSFSLFSWGAVFALAVTYLPWEDLMNKRLF